jgi:CRISPR-associated protein Cas2
MILSGYRAVWIFTMFDLPVDTKSARKAYADFRKNLLKDGFTMLQYSVYVRHCASEENADVHYSRITNFLPDDGEVRLVTITDKQFGRMETHWGKMRKPPPPTPHQLELF